jgi:8-oxo-dGTP pyrophosphatase MutT (NUDIX family)
MQDYQRHIAACNTPIDEPFVPWEIDGRYVGWLRPTFIAHLQHFDPVFAIDDDVVRLDERLQGFNERSAALADVARALAEQGVTPAYLDEPYAVTPGGRDEALCVVDRGAAAYFGVCSFGQHLNGFVRRDDGLHMWLGRRARDRLLFPGALDNMVAGGLPHALSLEQNLVKECAEEASVPESLAIAAKMVGVVSYNRVAERGLRRDVLYCYDLELPPDFEPRNADGEVEEFMLLPIEEVARLVRQTDDFKLNCNLVVIDFLVRHGLLDGAAPGYLDLVMGLRQPLAGAGRMLRPVL